MSQELAGLVQRDSRITHHHLISADRIAGTIVYDLAGKAIGEAHSVMIDKISGAVAYVVITFGDAVGAGANCHPIPWNMLKYDTGLDGYRVDIAHGDLEGAPSYGRDAIPDFTTDQRNDVDHFYRPLGEPQGAGVNRSDLNDGIDRPLGFYSRKAQAIRSGQTDAGDAVEPPNLRVDEAAPGFYSPEQQQARSDINSLQEQVRQPDPTLYEIDGRNDAASRWRNGVPGPGVC